VNMLRSREAELRKLTRHRHLSRLIWASTQNRALKELPIRCGHSISMSARVCGWCRAGDKPSVQPLYDPLAPSRLDNLRFIHTNRGPTTNFGFLVWGKQRCRIYESRFRLRWPRCSYETTQIRVRAKCSSPPMRRRVDRTPKWSESSALVARRRVATEPFCPSRAIDQLTRGKTGSQHDAWPSGRPLDPELNAACWAEALRSRQQGQSL
jgi:hypothetical protein